MSLALDAGAIAGWLLAGIRVAAFVVACPLVPRAVPMVARIALVMVLGVFLGEPAGAVVADLGALTVAATVNAVIGVVLGYLVGLLFHLFPVAGSVIDITSGLSVGQVFDPGLGEQGAVFSRLFTQLALVLFLVVGGLERLVTGLAMSLDAIPVTGLIAPGRDLLQLSVDLTGRLVMAGIEVALPVVASLFGAEVALGLASRFAPQMNVFLLGLPLKLLITFGTGGAALLLFPEAMSGLLDAVGGVFVRGTNGLVGAGS